MINNTRIMKRTLLLSLIPLLLAVVGCQRETNLYNPELGSQEVKAQFVFNIDTGKRQETKQTADATQAAGSEDGYFRGIGDGKLLTYALTKTQGTDQVYDDGQILMTDQDAAKIYNLSNVMGGVNGQFSGELNSRRVLEMSFPLQTNTLLFYGKSPNTSVDKDVMVDGVTPVTFSAKDYYGYLDDNTVSAKTGSANFQLGKRLQDEDGYDAMKKLIACALTAIMNTNLKGTNHVAITGVDSYPEISWSDYANTGTGDAKGTKSPVTPAEDLFPLEQKLATLYEEMTTIHYKESGTGGQKVKEVELRAGSGEATLRVLKDMWTVINGVRCATPICKEEIVAKFLAQKISDHLQYYVTSYISTDSGEVEGIPSDGSAITIIAYKDLVRDGDSGDQRSGWGVVKSFQNDAYYPTWTATTANPTDPYYPVLSDIDTDMKLIEFPMSFNILRGASYIVFKDGYFYYPDHFNTDAMGGGNPTGDTSTGFSVDDYYYPAELLYFGNSPVRTSEKSFKTSEYPASTAADWVDESKWSATEGTGDNITKVWGGTHVESKTHSVAMKYNIRYGVALLKTMVGYTQSALTQGFLEDNNAAIQARYGGSEQNKHIAIGNGSFKLTGVIIGGQPKNVGWDFLPCPDPDYATPASGDTPAVPSTTYSQGFIYDKAVVNQSVPLGNGSTFVPNYTTVFDNYKTGAQADQEPVYVALEFLNNTGEDFYGNFNLIRDGGYFYLIGELNISDKENSQTVYKSIDWPDETDGRIIPPYNTAATAEDKKSKRITRVFIQDFMTSATFKFGPTSLQAAYLTVPDLRASSLTLGLSVDINWQQGLKYEEVVMGGN